MFRGSIGRPVLVVKMSPVSCQARPSSSAVGGLDGAASLQGLGGQGKQGQVAAASGALDRADTQLAVDTLDVLADPQLVVLVVHVSPAQAEDFTAAQPVEQQEHERRVERIVLGGGQERAGLGRGPRGDRLAFPGGQLGQPGDVAHDQFLSHRPGQRRGQHGLHDLDLRIEWPSASWPVRKVWTRDADRRASGYLPSAGLRYSRTVISYSACVAGLRFAATTCSSQ